MTHSQALLPALGLMQVDNSCFFCSALKIRWLLALFSHAEELAVISYPASPLVYKRAGAERSPGCPLGQGSALADGELCPSGGPVARRATPKLRLPGVTQHQASSWGSCFSLTMWAQR